MDKGKIIISIIVGLFLITNILALPIYSGDNITFESEKFDYFTVVGNLTPIDGMEVIWDNGNMTLSFDKKFKSDNFSLIFFNELEKTVEESSSSSSSSGTNIIYKDRNVTEYVYLNKSPEIIEKEVIKEVTVGGEIKNELPKWAFFTLIILGFVTLISVGFIVYSYLSY